MVTVGGLPEPGTAERGAVDETPRADVVVVPGEVAVVDDRVMTAREPAGGVVVRGPAILVAVRSPATLAARCGGVVVMDATTTIVATAVLV